MKYRENQKGGPPLRNRNEKVYCYHCLGKVPTPSAQECQMIKKNLNRHTKRCHPNSCAAWLLDYTPLFNEREEQMIDEFLDHQIEHNNTNILEKDTKIINNFESNSSEDLESNFSLSQSSGRSGDTNGIAIVSPELLFSRQESQDELNSNMESKPIKKEYSNEFSDNLETNTNMDSNSSEKFSPVFSPVTPNQNSKKKKRSKITNFFSVTNRKKSRKLQRNSQERAQKLNCSNKCEVKKPEHCKQENVIVKKSPQKQGQKRQLSLHETTLEINAFKQRLNNLLQEIETKYNNEIKEKDYNEILQETIQSMKDLELELRSLIREKKKTVTKLDNMLNNASAVIHQRNTIDQSFQKLQTKVEGENSSLASVSKIELEMIEPQCRQQVLNIFKTNDNFEFHEGKLRCTTCFRFTASAKCISINTSVEYNTQRHNNSQLHKESLFKLKNYDANKNFYSNHVEEQKNKVQLMTENIFRVCYFILKKDLSMTLYEDLINLLDLCKTLIGDQCHSRNTARAMSLCIDEVFMKMLINFILENVDEFIFIADELTDVSGLKMMLTKIRLMENWELRELVFSVFESCGTSEKTASSFLSNLIEEFLSHSNLNKEQVKSFIASSLVGGGSDRANKMLKYNKILSDFTKNYITWNCDNHMCEGAMDNVRNSDQRLQKVEEVLKRCYAAVPVHSCSRKSKLKQTAEELQSEFVNLKNLFEIKFLTSEEVAMHSLIIDYEASMNLMLSLSVDTNIKAQKREDFTDLFEVMTDCRIYCNLLGIHDMLNKALSPYLLWSQKTLSNPFERKFAKQKMYGIMKNLEESNYVDEFIIQKLNLIDFEEKNWKRSGIPCKYCPKSLYDAIKMVVSARTQLGKRFKIEKEKIHQNEDPIFLKGDLDLSDIFDVRLWKNVDFMCIFKLTNFKSDLFKKIQTDKIFLFGVDKYRLCFEFGLLIDFIYNTDRLCIMKANVHILHQWSPTIEEFKSSCSVNVNQVETIVKRVITSSNNQRGCEGSNGKIARYKTKYSSRMGVEIINARSRAGENGPPLHAFPVRKMIKHWSTERHRLAAKVHSKMGSKVIKRIRNEENLNSTSKIFL